MIQINQIKLHINHTKEDLDQAVLKALKLKELTIEYEILKKSIDARKKDSLKYIYSIGLSLKNEQKVIKRANNKNITWIEKRPYQFQSTGSCPLRYRPIIIGAGPGGLFCGLMLAKAGYRPIILERGQDVDTRTADMEEYFRTRVLKPESNVQFGEGGAGTFSDGKLNTLIKDKTGRNRKVLEVFTEHGAPEEILYLAKPHIGTDLLRNVIRRIRETIIAHGGEVRFGSKVTDLMIEDERIRAVVINEKDVIPCETLILAIGHSARDTFSLLLKKGLSMHQKAFAVGLRIEHPAHMIHESQYGNSEEARLLPAADYKLTHHAANGRSVYSFCMCPGGYVVNSSSEEGRITVNGMSNHKRDGKNSNSAIIVNVMPEDFSSDSPLAGIEFQRKYEEAAFIAGGSDGHVPIQLYGDFKDNVPSQTFGEIEPSLKGSYTFANLKECLPDFVIDAIIDGVENFEHKIKGFARKDAVLSGVETRTSSPVRIERNEKLESNITGIFPCGEGAGYAGGITSAAMDGIKIAEELARRFKPWQKIKEDEIDDSGKNAAAE